MGGLEVGHTRVVPVAGPEAGHIRVVLAVVLKAGHTQVVLAVVLEADRIAKDQSVALVPGSEESPVDAKAVALVEVRKYPHRGEKDLARNSRKTKLQPRSVSLSGLLLCQEAHLEEPVIAATIL